MSRSRRAPIVCLLGLAIARNYRNEILADLLEDERQLRATGASKWRARLALYAQLIRSAVDSRKASRDGNSPSIRARNRALSGLGADFKIAWRLHRSRPVPTLLAVLTLALASGANTTLFSVANAVLWRPLPFNDPGTLVFVWDVGTDGARRPLPPARGLDFRNSQALSDLALVGHRSFVVSDAGPPEEWRGASVSGNFFDVLGTTAALGRTFHEREVSRDVVVLSHRLWRTRFAADPSVVGRTFTMNGRPRVVLGVMGEDFYWPAITAEPGPVDAPLCWAMADGTDVPEGATRSAADARLDRNTSYLRAVARLAPHTDLSAAQAEIAAHASRLGREHPQTDANRTATVVPAMDQLFGSFRRPMLLLVASTLLVVLIAGANVANLLLIRLSSRGRELSVRLALGATGARVTRQIVIEGLTLAAAGAVIGLVVAKLSFGTIAALAPETIGRLDRLTLDPRPLAMSVAVTVGTGLVVGMIPGLALTRRKRRLTAGSRGDVSAGGARLRHGLVIAEIALALVLVIGATLFSESLLRLRRVDVGFDPSRLLTFNVMTSGRRPDGNQSAYFDELLHRIRQVPGVSAAAGAVTLPIGGDDFGTRLTVEGQPSPQPGNEPRIGYQIVTPGWFETLGLRLRGRDFRLSDDGTHGQVVIVNETFARTAWPGTDPIGRRIRKGRNPANPWMTVVGVVSDVRHSGPGKPPRPEVFEPYYQTSLSFVAIAVRTGSDPRQFVAPIRSAIADVDSRQPMSDVATMEEHLADAYGDLRFLSVLTLSFGALALLLAAMGVYGVVGCATAQRMREFGVRLALGATPRGLARLVFTGGLRTVVIGLALGAALALGFSEAIRGLLFETAPTNPFVYATAVIVLLVAALLALWMPARRASQADPIDVLRAD
jgi:putative ABC transport system permease protein